MKLSFSLASKSSSSKQQPNSKPLQNFNRGDDQEEETTAATYREYVSEFDASRNPSGSSSKKVQVIPPKPNEWQPYKKMKNIDLPLRSSSDPVHADLKFEVEAPSSVADGGPNISYGLNLRQNSESGHPPDPPSPPPPPPTSSLEAVMLQKLKEDLKSLPDESEDHYADMPVEDFAAALLKGYGWYEGRGIGRNAKEDVKTKQYERRTATEGFRSFALAPNKNSDTNASNSSSKALNEKKKEEEKNNSGGAGQIQEGLFYVGKYVRIIGGADMGLKGRIVEVLCGGDSIILKLSRSEEEVKVRTYDVAELGSVEEEICLRKLKELKIKRSKDGMDNRDGRRTKDDGRRVKDSKSDRNHRESMDGKIEQKKKNNKRSREGGRRSEQSNAQVQWLTSHIRVRIISKDLKGGRLYLRKGEVVDVVGPTTCDITMDDSRELIQGVDQDLLETALPRRGGPVLVLYGKHKGVYGSLVERNAENETGVIRDADSHALLNVRLEEIAEYMGDPSYIGY